MFWGGCTGCLFTWNLVYIFDEVSVEESSVFPCFEEKLKPIVMFPIFLPLDSCWGHVLTPVVKALREEAL